MLRGKRKGRVNVVRIRKSNVSASDESKVGISEAEKLIRPRYGKSRIQKDTNEYASIICKD